MSRYYGNEKGEYECACRGCGRFFLSLTPLGCYCRDCRRPVIDGLQMRERDMQPVLLDCVKTCGRWVPHVFLRYERVKARDKTVAIRVYYACQRCGSEQQYGYQDPGATKWKEGR